MTQGKYITFRVQCLLLQRHRSLLTCYVNDSGELTQALLFHNFLSFWREQLVHLCTRPSPWNTQDWREGWAVPFPDWPCIRPSVLPRKYEKSTGVVNVTCAGKGEKQPRRDVALFRAWMPVDKTLLVHISWSLGGLTVCSRDSSLCLCSDLPKPRGLVWGLRDPCLHPMGMLWMLALPRLCGCWVEFFWMTALKVGA